MLTLSKTRINTFLGCSEKYRLRYELGLRPFKRAKNLVEGSAIHQMVECGLLYRDSPPVDVLEHASKSFWESCPIDLCDYADEGEYLKAQSRCLAESKVFLEQLGPLPVTQVELKLEWPLVHPITLAEHPGINLLGYIDLLIYINRGSFCVADLKTAAKTPRAWLGRLAMELTFYAYLYSQPFAHETTFSEVSVALIHLVRTKEPKTLWDEGQRSLPDFLSLYRLCRKVAADIKAGHYWPCPGVHCGWCEYESLCFLHDEKAIAKFGERHWRLYHQDAEERREVKLPLKSAVGF